jgi:cation transport ATPase
MDNHTNQDLLIKARRSPRSTKLVTYNDNYISSSTTAPSQSLKSRYSNEQRARSKVRSGYVEKELQDRKQSRRPAIGLMLTIFAPFVVASILSVFFGLFGLFSRVADAAVFTWHLSFAAGFYFFIRNLFRGVDTSSIVMRIILAIVLAIVYVPVMYFATFLYTSIFGCAVMNDCPMLC